MPSTYKTPGVYVEEISKFPPSVAAVETAIPAFIGYTEKNQYKGLDLQNKPTRIKSLADFREIFGGPHMETFTAQVSGDQLVTTPTEPAFVYKMYPSLELFFANGGGPCYIVSVNVYNPVPAVVAAELQTGLDTLKKEDEPTMILFPDATSLTGATRGAEFYNLYNLALQQCADLGDRIAICDVFDGHLDYTTVGNDVINRVAAAPIQIGFRNGIGNNNLKYGVAYYPWLETILTHAYDESTIAISGAAVGTMLKMEITDDMTPAQKIAAEAISLYHTQNALYHDIKKIIDDFKVVLPPSSAMAGIYAAVDENRGVWKAPANVSVTAIKKPSVVLDNDDQESLNVHSTGKSVNAIRTFKGKGTIVWGARSLAGNDNEWRYISVRRFFNMVEESVKKASGQFVFEPNDKNTWEKVRGMISNFLFTMWRQGALAGAVPEDAYYVNIGLPETMTAEDILNGYMIVEIGMAVVRPAEFIILKFSHKMQES